MITEEYITKLVEQEIGESGIFLVEVKVGSGNDIRVLLDSAEGVSIDTCAGISRALGTELDQQQENYSLEVSSPGIGAPLKLMQQYEKNIGRDVEVITKDGLKRKGKLVAVEDDFIGLEVAEKVKSPGKKGKKRVIMSDVQIAFEEIKSTKVVVSL